MHTRSIVSFWYCTEQPCLYTSECKIELEKLELQIKFSKHQLKIVDIDVGVLKNQCSVWKIYQPNEWMDNIWICSKCNHWNTRLEVYWQFISWNRNSQIVQTDIELTLPPQNVVLNFFPKFNLTFNFFPIWIGLCNKYIAHCI